MLRESNPDGGDDRLFGQNGDDQLEGGDGDDRLDGGPGTNTNDGGDDWDRCVNPNRSMGALKCEQP